MLAIDKNKVAKKELKRFKEALKGMENYLSRMARGVDEIHHCGYVATAPMSVTQTVQKIVYPQEGGLDRHFKMVFRFELTGDLKGKVTYCPIHGFEGVPDSLSNVSVEEFALVSWFLTKGIYQVLTDLLQEVVNKHNESTEEMRKQIDAFVNWSDLANSLECESECPAAT